MSPTPLHWLTIPNVCWMALPGLVATLAFLLVNPSPEGLLVAVEKTPLSEVSDGPSPTAPTP